MGCPGDARARQPLASPCRRRAGAEVLLKKRPRQRGCPLRVPRPAGAGGAPGRLTAVPRAGSSPGSSVAGPRPGPCPYPRVPSGITSQPSGGLQAAPRFPAVGPEPGCTPRLAAARPNCGERGPPMPGVPRQKSLALTMTFLWRIVSGGGKSSLPPPCARTRLGSDYLVVCAHVMVLSKVVSMVQRMPASYS